MSTLFFRPLPLDAVLRAGFAIPRAGFGALFGAFRGIRPEIFLPGPRAAPTRLGASLLGVRFGAELGARLGSGPEMLPPAPPAGPIYVGTILLRWGGLGGAVRTLDLSSN